MKAIKLNKTNKAALFFAMVLLPTGMVYGQEIKRDSVQNEKKIDEIVMIGYGTQRKEAITGSVSSVDSKTLKEIPAGNITQALQGRVSGVDLQQSSSQPGATLQIRIRGTRSLTAGNDPLIVLDGIPFPGSLSDISPNDIKTIDILKDASSTAIYGSRGANGVIIVTTNKGRTNQKPQVSYNAYFGVKNIFSEYPMMNGAQYTALRAAAGYVTPLGKDEQLGVDTDYQKLLFTGGAINSHDLGVSGGSETGSYNFGLGYYKDQGVVPGQNFERFSLRASIDQKIGKSIKIGFTTNSNYSITNGSGLSIYSSLSNTPISNPYNPDGTLKRTIVMAQDENWLFTKDSFNALGDNYIDRDKSLGTYNSLYTEINIPGVKGLKYRANLGLNLIYTNSGQFTGTGVFSSNPANLNDANIGNSNSVNWVIENLLTYDRTFGKHKINAVALYSSEQTTFNSSFIDAKDIPSSSLQYYNLGQALGTITIDPKYQAYQQYALQSLMGRVMYSYDDKYLLSAALRSDGSSRLAPGHKYNTYPALSAGWNIKRESFMDNVSVIDQLKFRFGYGETSNQGVDPYQTLGSLSSLPYNFNTSTAVGYNVSAAPNYELGWEYSKTLNYGVDFGLFNNRLSGTVEYYVTDTKDLLQRVGLPPTSGVTSYLGNVASSQNKGYEISLNGSILNNPNGFSWDIGANFYSNKNKIVSLSSGLDRDESNHWFVGSPINVIYDYKKIGLWQEGDPNLAILEPGGNVGMIKVLYTGGYNADGTPTRAIGPDDRQIINVDPKFQGGFNTRVAYKKLDLVVVGAFQSGGVLISSLYSDNGYLNMLSGRRNNVNVDYWTPTNTGASFPKPGGITSGDNPKYGSTLGYFDASYVKIRALTVGYNFDKNLLNNMGVSSLRVYVTAQNPFVLYSPYYKQTGMDPETNTLSRNTNTVASTTTAYNPNILTIGTNTPSTRNYLIGLNLTF